MQIDAGQHNVPVTELKAKHVVPIDLKLCFRDSKSASPDSELRRRVAKPWIRDSSANGVIGTNGVCMLPSYETQWVIGSDDRKETTMARMPKKQRNEEQRARQAKTRAKAKAERKPERDDFARVLLWLMIREAQGRRDPRGKLDALRDAITPELERQGFHIKHCEDAFEALADRYASGLNPFRPKRHLGAADDLFLDPDADPDSGSVS